MSLRLFAMTCGWLDLPYPLMMEGADGIVTVPVPAFLIEHPEGSALFDSGLPLGMQGDKPQQRREVRDIADAIRPRFIPGEEVSARMRSAGRDPGGVDFLINSHLHFDHAGGNALIPTAKLIVQEQEWAYAHNPEGMRAEGYNPAHYRREEVVLIDGWHDLFGDGTVICVPTYRHTPGHQSLLVRLADGDVLITSDACYFPETLVSRRLPEVVSDPQQMAESLDDICGC